jgi:uncharacterized protein YciI
MTEISDSDMQEQLGKTREYALVLIKPGPQLGSEGSRELIWEHGRRNFQLRAEGLLSIVGPVHDDTDLCGIGIFNTSLAAAAEIMAGDPAVLAGLFTFEVHPFKSFPGDSLASLAR